MHDTIETTTAPATSPSTAAQKLHRLHLLADWYVTSDIELSCPSVRLPESAWLWHDTRPMLDEREHCPEFIDMSRIALDYAVSTGLFARHPQQPHLLRFVRRAL